MLFTLFILRSYIVSSPVKGVWRRVQNRGFSAHRMRVANMLLDVISAVSFVSPELPDASHSSATCSIADDLTASRSCGKKTFYWLFMCNLREVIEWNMCMSTMLPFQGMLRFGECDSSCISLIKTKSRLRPFSTLSSCHGRGCRYWNSIHCSEW